MWPLRLKHERKSFQASQTEYLQPTQLLRVFDFGATKIFCKACQIPMLSQWGVTADRYEEQAHILK